MIAYRRFLKELWSILAPGQKNKGGGSVQVGHMTGNVTVINHHHGTRSPNDRRASAAQQREVLDMMDRVPDRITVLKFMEREFATRMVIDLHPSQLYRLRRYLEVVIAKTTAPSARLPPEHTAEPAELIEKEGPRA